MYNSDANFQSNCLGAMIYDAAFMWIALMVMNRSVKGVGDLPLLLQPAYRPLAHVALRSHAATGCHAHQA